MHRKTKIEARRGLALWASVSVVVTTVLLARVEARAQPAPSASTEVTIPAVEVRAPRVRPRRAAARRAGPTRVAAPRRQLSPAARRPAAQPPLAPAPVASRGPGVGSIGSGTGSLNGLVATRTTSGSKTSTALIETPQAVSVVGAAQVELQRAQTLNEAVRYTPGVRAESFGNDPRRDFFLIRGFDATARGIFLDNLQLYMQGFASFKLEPFGIERFETLRGPSSVLYGGGNPGGLVNAISKTPPAEPLRFVEFGINNFGRAFGAYDFGGPLVVPGASPADGQFLYRMTGITKAGGTQVDFVGDDRVYIAPSFTWKPTDATSLTVLGSFTRDASQSTNFLPYNGSVLPGQFGGRVSRSLFIGDPSKDRYERTQGFAGYQFEHRIDDTFTIRQNARYSYLDITGRTVYGNGFANAAAERAGQLSRINFETTPRVNLFNVDNQLESRFTTGALSHTLLTGLDYRRYNLADNQNFRAGTLLDIRTGAQLPNPFLDPRTRSLNSRFVQDQLGVYVQDQVRLDRFTLALSGRYDFVATDTANFVTPSLSRTGEEGRFSGRAGLIYTSDIGIAPYASYSNSFNPQVGLNGATRLPLRSETGEQIEVGVKYQPEGSASFVAVSAFDLRRQNVLTTNPANLLLSVQTGEVRSTGMEVEAVANVYPGLNVIGAYTVYDLDVVKDQNPALIGRRPTNIPEQFGGLFVDYTIQDGPLRGLGFGGGVRQVGRSFADAQNLFRVPSYVVGDAQVHYERAGWRAAVNLTNVTDERYVASCSALSACFYGESRRITGSISYRW